MNLRKNGHAPLEPATGSLDTLLDWLARVLGFPGDSSGRTPESKRAERIVEALVTQARRRAELVISSGRLVFVAVILAHFLNSEDGESLESVIRMAIELPVLIATMCLSVLLVAEVFRRGVSQQLLDVSVVLDALACGLTLLPGVLQPWPSYHGLLRSPDLAILPVIYVASGLRFSMRTALVGALANSVLFGVLVTLDRSLNLKRIEYGPGEVELYLVYLVAATALGVVLATRAHALAQGVARYAERAEAARKGLSRVLQDNHDVRSLMTSARLNADLVARSLEEEGAASTAHAASVLRANLGELADLVAGSRDRAYLELAVTADLEPTEVTAVARRVIEAVAQRFSGVAFLLNGQQGPLQAWVVGGSRGLERVLLNLLVNAGEGDGTTLPARVRLCLGRVQGFVEVEVTDDGPGFPASVLAERSERFVSTKKNGSGLGLYLVENIVLASGGQLRLENTGHGARASVLLLPASAAR